MATPAAQLEQTRRIRIRGVVQGVGFRPTVWRLARAFGLRGEVCNDGQGVSILACAPGARIDAFLHALRAACPPLARIDGIEQSDDPGAFIGDDFRIAESGAGGVRTGIVPDAATCPDCLRELNDPADRRHRYPFINCTHCGPRLSIVWRIPYDRASTAMAGFALCETCRAEYDNPADRRFHAQPTACPVCGPRAWLSDGEGREIPCDDPIAAAAAAIAGGAIVAVKGIGGFHLACDARNAAAVAELRRRKRRPHKPLAMMARDLAQLRAYCRVGELEAATLAGPAAPIVLLDALDPTRLPAAIAPGQCQWGFMLPYSPLHHLLMAALPGPVVLTSGNRAEAPPCIDNDDALARLADQAELFLLHDRPIEQRLDDSLVRRLGGAMQPLRRARGYAPGQLPLPPGFDHHPPLLALGGELKNTLCLLSDGQAVLSQHLGDLEEARTFAEYRHAIALYAALYEHRPAVLAVDRHPSYLSTQLGREWAAREGLALVEVQHHHAHLAACLADNGVGLEEAPLLGVVLDGLGLGDDGSLWGGEILLADYCGYRRLAHLKPVPLPGGAQAQREPWRNLYAQLHAAFGAEAVARGEFADIAALRDRPLATLGQMIARGINAPPSTSAGRLFDAVAGALDLAPARLSYEAQAAMALEAACDPQALHDAEPYPFALQDDGGPLMIDPAPCWRALLAERARGVAVGRMAARFHSGLAQALVDVAARLGREHAVGRVALSGGVLQNRVLFEALSAGLRGHGLEVLVHRQVPANDGGLALGQALVAAARWLKPESVSS